MSGGEHDILSRELRGLTYKVILSIVIPFLSTAIFVVNGYVHLMVEINSFKKDTNATNVSITDIKNSIIDMKKDIRSTNERIDLITLKKEK